MAKSKKTIDVESNQQDWFVRAIGVFGLLLIGFSWKLWTHQTDFPAVPIFDEIRHSPHFFDVAFLSFILVSLVGMVISPAPYHRLCLVVFFISVVSSTALNQHRLQPWVCHLAIITLFLVAKNRKQSRFFLQAVAISIYLYAGIGKLDYQFVHTLGQDFVCVIFDLLGVAEGFRSPERMGFLAGVLPCLEILVGLLLCFKAIRIPALILGCLFHVCLIVILSPLGLNHQMPVLIWNLFFIVWLNYLFWPRTKVDTDALCKQPFSFLSLVLGFAVLLFPATRFVGQCDHWTGWEVYAPRSSRVQLEVFETPEELKPYMNGNAVDLAKISLDRLGVPIYPQQRFQIGVVSGILEQHGLEKRFRATLLEESDRWTGDRKRSTITEFDELQNAASKFRLNGLPTDP